MKKVLLFHFLAALMTVGCLAQSNEEKAVGAAVENLRKAMVSGDRTALENSAASQLTYGHSSGLIENKQEFVEHIASGRSDFVTIDLTDQTITVTGDVALVRHTFNATTNDNGNTGSIKLLILTVWQKQKGKWMLIARQAVRAPN